MARRERIVWHPEWSEEYASWSRSFIHRNKWRCDPVNGPDDLLQEAYLLFRYVAATYPRVIDPAFFMALFKRAMNNKMHDRSCHYSRRKGTVEAPISTDVYEVFAGRMGEVTNCGFLAAALSEAPEELKLVLAMLAEGKLDAPAPVRGTLQPREHISTRAIAALKACGVVVVGDPIGDLRKLLA